MQREPKSRNTQQRKLVLETVLSMRNHPDAEMVYEVISKRNPLISKATVYRNLKLLVKQGQILHIPIPNGADCFDFNLSPHYHIKCRKCSRVFDVDIPYQTNICDSIENNRGFVIESHQIVFSGLCPDCK